MSGVTVPANIIVEPFGTAAVDPTYITLPIPVPTQTGVLAGAASFADGFPPATMSDPESEGGVPPFGQDMNGILYMISAYAALLQAGQIVTWNTDAATAFAGYAVGARVASTVTPGLVWTNNLDGNTDDPDADASNWIADRPLYLAVATSGALNNVILPGPSDYVIDYDTTAGALNVSGWVAQRDNQKLYINNVGANLFQALANNAGSTVTNRVRAATDLALVQNQTLTLQYSILSGAVGAGKWLLV